MKVFRGIWLEGEMPRVEVGVCVSGVDGPHWHDLDLHRDVCEASEHFAWGVVRPPMLQLAGAILAECSDAELARSLYVEFAVSVVTKLPLDEWRLTASEVHEWVQRERSRQAKKKNDAAGRGRRGVCSNV